MPEHLPFTIGPVNSLNLNAAAEMLGVMGCVYAGDQDKFDQIVGPLVPAFTERLFWYTDPTHSFVACAVWTQPGHLYIAFGGTHSWHQWPRHFTGTVGAEYRNANNQPVGGVGVQGFHQQVARTMWDLAFATFPEDWQTREIRVTGHSLGGSVAQLVAWRFAQLGLGEQTQTITFGAPRVILGPYRGPRPKAEYRVTNIDDIVPYVPFKYQTAVIENVRNIFAVRGGRSRGSQRMTDERERSPADTWNHYGDAYRVSETGHVVFFREGDDPQMIDPFHQVLGKIVQKHLTAAYIARQEAALFQYGGQLQAFQALDIGRQALANPANPVPPITVPPGTGADIVYSNAQLVPAPAAPLTPGNLGSTQGIGHSWLGVGLSDSTLKGNVFGGTMSSLWDLSIFVNNTIHGTSNTVALNGATEAQARAAVQEFARLRSFTLGNDQTTVGGDDLATASGRGSPAIEYARIRDAQNPRLGDVFPLRPNHGEPSTAPSGPIVSVANAADPLFVSLNLTLRATVGNVQKKTILKITGIPDKVIRSNTYNGSETVGVSGIPFDTHLRNLLNFLTAPTGLALGISGLDPANEKTITAWVPDPVTGRAKATIPGHGYVDGDQIRITRTKFWYLNRTWEVEVPDVNTIILKRSQLTAAQGPPSKGRANRVVLANGTKVTTFYRFDRPSWLDASPATPTPLRLSRKRPGGQFIPTSFQGGRKKIKL